MFDDDRKLIYGDDLDEALKIKDIAKYGCFGFWLQMEEFKTKVPALTIDKEQGSKVTIEFIFKKARTSSTFGIKYKPESKIIQIISKDIKKDVKKNDWLYAQICIKDKKFKPYIYYPKGELKADSWKPMKIGTAEHATAYVGSDEDTTLLTGRLYSPFYTKGLLLNGIPDLRNFGISTHHLVLDIAKQEYAGYNNLHNGILNPRVEAAFARFNGTDYKFASGEYNQYYPDFKLDLDMLPMAPNKNAMMAKGIRSIGMPSTRTTFRMTVNFRVDIKKLYKKSQGRDYDTEIPPLYTWMDKKQNEYLTCWPEFKVTKSKDKTTWNYGKKQTVKCDFRGGLNGVKSFTFNTGKDGIYFVNLIIFSDDSLNIYVGQAGTNLKKIKLGDNNPIYPRDTDYHLWGGIKKNHLQEPSPFLYDYELINIHTGYAGEKAVLDSKKGFERYKKYANKPITALGIHGLDAVNCKEPKAASFWNGKNFACLKWESKEVKRELKLTKEKNKRTRKHFKDWSCNRHAVLKINRTCGACPKNCDVCNKFKTCHVCKPGYELSEDKAGCEKCEDDQIFDVISKSCIKRIVDTNGLQFGAYHNRVSSSTEFLGPDNHGEVMVFEGKIYLKNRSGSQHKMYTDKSDPIYPDDNILIMVSINDVSEEVYMMSVRTDEGFERDFYVTVPVPKLSELKIQFKLSNFGNVEDYDSIKMKGYAFRNQTYISNYTRHRLRTVKESLDIQTGIAKKSHSKILKKIIHFAGNAITDFKEMTTKLMHFDSLEPEEQEKIKNLNLDLSGAIKRCESLHQSCEGLFGTMAVKKCPPKYERVGCCKCALPCDVKRGFVDDGLFCKKPESYSTEEFNFET